MKKYELDDLKSFMAVAESGGFTSAGDLLNTSTASISRRVSALENALGVELLRRTTRRIMLTEAGESFYADLITAFRILSEAEEHARKGRVAVCGHMKIAAPMSFGVQMLTPVLPSFMERYPDLTVTLHLEDRYTDLVAEGIDVAVRIGNLSDSSLIAKRISSIPRVFVASPGYIERRGFPVCPGSLDSHVFLRYSLGGPQDDLANLFGSSIESLHISERFSANNAEVLRECAVQGLGIVMLPVFAVQNEIADGRLIRVLESVQTTPFSLYAVRQSGRLAPARIRAFISYLEEHFS